MELNYEEILSKAKNIVLKAGEIVKEAFESRNIINSTIEIKDSNPADLVTAVDKNVEKMLYESLKNSFPSFLFIGEETISFSKTKKVNLTDSPTWVIDPVDGTTNFVHGFPFVCISVGLVVKKEPVLGIIFNPILNEMYWGIKGKGAFMNDKKLPLIKNTSLKSLQKSLIVTEFQYLGQDKIDYKIGDVKNIFSLPAHGIRSLGSCALNILQVARGGADFFVHIGMHIWDIAAAMVILRETGGVIVGFKRPKNLDDKILIVDEPFDICGRKALCIRGIDDGKEYQSKLLGEIREKIKDFEIESD